MFSYIRPIFSLYFRFVAALDYSIIMVSRWTILAVIAIAALVSSEEDVTANLLVSKVILNKYLVQGKDLTIEYNIYNVGDG